MRTDRRLAFIVLITGLTVLSGSAIVYLTALPSSHSGDFIGVYSPSRLILISGPFFTLIIFGGFLIKALRNHRWSQHIADQVYGAAQPVLCFGILIMLLATVLVALLLQVNPNPLVGLNAPHIERLLPYLILLPFFLALYTFTYRLQSR
jgi:hypothetical protein